MIISPNQIVSYCNSSELFIRHNINNATRHKVPSFFFFKFVSLALANSKKKREKKRGGRREERRGGLVGFSGPPGGVCMWWWCNKAVYSKLAQRFGAPPAFSCYDLMIMNMHMNI
jgi:hypothetical protein